MSRKPTRDAAKDLERLRGTKVRSSGSARSSGGGVRKSSVNLDEYLGGGGSGGGGGKSLFGQVGSVFSALPAGIAGLGGQAWDSTVGNVGSVAQNVLNQICQDELWSWGFLTRAAGAPFASVLVAAIVLYVWHGRPEPSAPE